MNPGARVQRCPRQFVPGLSGFTRTRTAAAVAVRITRCGVAAEEEAGAGFLLFLRGGSGCGRVRPVLRRSTSRGARPVVPGGSGVAGIEHPGQGFDLSRVGGEPVGGLHADPGSAALGGRARQRNVPRTGVWVPAPVRVPGGRPLGRGLRDYDGGQRAHRGHPVEGVAAAAPAGKVLGRPSAPETIRRAWTHPPLAHPRPHHRP